MEIPEALKPHAVSKSRFHDNCQSYRLIKKTTVLLSQAFLVDKLALRMHWCTYVARGWVEAVWDVMVEVINWSRECMICGLCQDDRGCGVSKSTRSLQLPFFSTAQIFSIFGIWYLLYFKFPSHYRNSNAELQNFIVEPRNSCHHLSDILQNLMAWVLVIFCALCRLWVRLVGLQLLKEIQGRSRTGSLPMFNASSAFALYLDNVSFIEDSTDAEPCQRLWVYT